MKKTNSIVRFVIMAVLCLVLLALTVFQFSLTGKLQDNDFVGFARAINFGIDFRGGVVEEYSVKRNSSKNGDIKTGVASNVTRINYLLQNEGYDVNVYKNGDNISIEFLDEYSPLDISQIINKKVTFSIKTSSGDDAEDVVTANDIQDAYGTTSGTQNILVLTFTRDGADNFQKVIDSRTGYFYINSDSPMSVSLSGASNSYVGLTVENLDIAKNYASQIMSAKYDLSFENESTTTVTSQMAQKNRVVAICLLVGLFVVCTIILCLVFHKLGLVGSFILLIGVLLQIVLLQAIPTSVFEMTVPAYFASLLCMLLGALTLFLIFSKMHGEYKKGKILYASVKFGYDKIWAQILEFFAILLVSSIATYFLSTYLVKQFAMALMAGFVVYATTILLCTKFFTRWFSNISYNSKDYGFKREANINELK